MSTKIEYLYRDASNYKQYGTVVVAGAVTDAQKQTIVESLDDGSWFVAEQVGFPNPRDRFGAVTDDDHGWCELGDGGNPSDAFTVGTFDVTVNLTIHEVVKAFRRAATEGWDPVSPPVPA